MPRLDNVPDPDRGDSPVSPSQAPQVFDPDSGEESDDVEEAGEEGHGYEPINQEDLPDDEQDGEDGLSMEDQVAALVRAAQSDPENLSERTREEMEKAEAEKREEEAREKADIWQAAPREDSIQMDEAKVATIKSLMSKISLPHAPPWAKEGQDQEWREKL